MVTYLSQAVGSVVGAAAAAGILVVAGKTVVALMVAEEEVTVFWACPTARLATIHKTTTDT